MLDKRTIVIIVGLVSIISSAYGEEKRKPPFTGEVTGTNVYVRSGPGINYYPCMKLSRPAKVRVVGEVPGWFKILPPAGSFSLISKKYVHAQGNTGTVTGTNVLVRAGSDLPFYASRIDCIQTKLNIGDKVTIIGSKGDYYKILPPKGVYLWISSRYVRPLSPTTQPSPKTTTAPASTSQPTTAKAIIIPTTQPEALRKAIADFEAAEKALQAEMKKPRESWNLSALIAKYRAIRISADSPLAPYIEARIRFLNEQMELLKDLREVNRIVQDVDLKQAELEAMRERLKLAMPTTRPARTYIAEGILLASELFPGGTIGPKRYLLRDPHTHLIISYVQCTTGAVDLSKYIGAQVRIIGTSHYDDALRMYIIEAERVEVIQPAPKQEPARKVEPAPAPTRETKPTEPAPKAAKPTPTTKPTPTPAPKRTPAPSPSPKTKPAAKPKPAPSPELKSPPSKVKKSTPTSKPASPTKQAPTTMPAESSAKEKTVEKPIPPTGLPVVEPATQPAEEEINPEEYE